MPSQLERTRAIFSSRLDTLTALLDKASAEWRRRNRDPESLLAARLADDMYPLTHQIVFTAEHPRQLAAFCANRDADPHVDPASLNLASAHALLREVRAAILAIDVSNDAALERQRTLHLQDNIVLQLPGTEYLHDFLMPNFYFHLVTSYNILRHLGVSLGKGDYMAHLASRVQRPGAG
jgi:hypothetical protein